MDWDTLAQEALDKIEVENRHKHVKEIFVVLHDYPGYMVSSQLRIFNQGIYNLHSIGIVPPLEGGPRAGRVRIHSPKGYSVYVNPEKLWLKVSHQPASEFILSKRLCDDENFKTLEYDFLRYSRYLVSDYGRVFDYESCRFLTPTVLDDDKAFVMLMLNGTRKSVYIPKLVLTAFNFLGGYDPTRPIVHKNGKVYDNRYSNLIQPVPMAYNPDRTFDTSRTKIIVEETGEFFYNSRECAEHFNTTMSNINRILNDENNNIINNQHIYRKKIDA